MTVAQVGDFKYVWYVAGWQIDAALNMDTGMVNAEMNSTGGDLETGLRLQDAIVDAVAPFEGLPASHSVFTAACIKITDALAWATMGRDR